MRNNEKIKYGFYISGIVLSIFYLTKYGLSMNSHTPSIGFILPFLFLIVGFVWGITDMIINWISSSTKIYYKSHIIGISMHTIIIISMFIYLAIF